MIILGRQLAASLVWVLILNNQMSVGAGIRHILSDLSWSLWVFQSFHHLNINLGYPAEDDQTSVYNLAAISHKSTPEPTSKW